MALAETIFWTSGTIIFLEVLFILYRAYHRPDVIIGALFFLCLSIDFIGLGFITYPETSMHRLGYVFLGIGLPLTGFFWLVFSTLWGRDIEDDPLLRRNKGWFVLTFLIAIALIVMNLTKPFIEYIHGSYTEASIITTGYVFPSYIFLLTVFLFGLYNTENCYRAALGSQKRLLRTGFYSGLILTAMMFAFATLGIIQGRLAVWALIGLAVPTPFLLMALVFHLIKVAPHRSKVVVTRRASSSSAIIISGAVYFLIVGLLSRAMEWFEFAPDFLVVVIAGMLATLLALAVLITSRLINPSRITQPRQKDFVTIEGIKDFIEEVSIHKNVNELLEQVRLFLKSSFGINNGALVEQLGGNVCSMRFFNMTSRQISHEGMKSLCEWLHRYGHPIRFADLAERISENDISIEWLEEKLGFPPSLVVPVIGRQKMVGILILEESENDSEKLEGLSQVLEMVASPLALAIQNCRITEELIVAREIESFNKIASYVLHDLKNSVGMLDMMLVNANKNMDNPEFRKSMLRTIGDAVNRQRHIIARLSEPDKGSSTTITSIDIIELLNQVIDKVQVRKVERIQLTERYDKIPVIKGNASVLKSVFENIIVNAIEAMPVSGQLQITTKSVVVSDQDGDKSQVVVILTDTGMGMSRAFIENKLFRPFTSTKKKGLGIGMYQTYEAIHQMGGNIEVTSQEGEGTTFTITLPA